jgi:CTP:molybdopterin cytidylyltransferase MocA
MLSSSTVIITACEGYATPMTPPVATFDMARELCRTLLPCGLSIVLVMDGASEHANTQHSENTTFYPVELNAVHPLDRHVEALVEGVLFSARSPGWIWIPFDTPMMRWATVQAVAEVLQSHPLVHAEHAQQAGIPLGIGAELYSEVVQLNGHRGLQRLRARYPARAVPVNDPGVVMSRAGRMMAHAPPSVTPLRPILG